MTDRSQNKIEAIHIGNINGYNLPDFILRLRLVYTNLGENMSMSLALIIAFIAASVVMVKHEMSVSKES